MGLGLFLLYGFPQGVEVASMKLTALPVSALMILNFEIPLSASVASFFLVLWILYVCGFLAAWLDEPRFKLSIRELYHARLRARNSNYLAILPMIAAATLAVVIVIQALQESTGVQTGGISFENPVIGFLTVSYAPIVEEFSYRITTIGLIYGLYLIFRTRKSGRNSKYPDVARLLLLTMWKPQRGKELMGLNTIRSNGFRYGISRFEWLLLGVSSAAFGAVHFLAGGGWQIGKISTAFMSGMVLGITYLMYGAYAPVLLHWFFNVYLGSFNLAAELGVQRFDSIVMGVQLLNFAVGAFLCLAIAATGISKAWSHLRVKESNSVGGPPNVS
jgi:hypothetical protein